MASVIYTTGGTVQAGGGLYIERAADIELLELCLSGAFAYVLTARQMGKSSLMAHTIERLNRQGVRTVAIDLTTIGTQVSAEQWYLGILDEIGGQLGLATDPLIWWEARAHQGFTQRLSAFLQEVLLSEVAEPVVVFVDEIDTTLSLDFTDDFYALIRALYNARAQHLELKRLGFVLLGVAMPGDLIRDPQRTPFNIGQAVLLTDFTSEEARPLAVGLGLPLEQAECVLRRVLYWTGGHPYLTQRLCTLIAAQPHVIWSDAEVNALVRDTLLGERSRQDNNLLFVRDMLTRRAEEPTAVLTIYRAILRGRCVPDDERSLAKAQLKLAGAVRREGALLKVRNRIYAVAFDERWTAAHMPRDYWLRQLLQVAIVATVVLLIISMLLGVYIAGSQSREAELKAERDSASYAQQTAVAERAIAVAAQQIAQQGQATAIAIQRVTEQKQHQAQAQALSLSLRTLADPELALILAVKLAESVQRFDIEDEQGRIFSSLHQAIIDSHIRSRFNGHTNTVDAVNFSNDGFRVVSASYDNTARIWDSKTGRSLNILQGHTGRVFSAAFSPDGTRVLTASDDNTARIWNATTGKALLILRGHTAKISNAAFSPDGTRVLTASDDNTARIWNATTGQTSLILQGHTDKISNAVFSPDGTRVLTASDDNTARIWNAATGQTSLILQGHTDKISNAVFSPDGTRVLTASDDNTARIWVIIYSEEIYKVRVHYHTEKMF